jgi:membrane-bound metal-dependent hydrolase YbcI (DUF457 family)
MTPIAHSGIGLLGWQITASRKNIKTLLLFLFVANMPDVDFLLHLIFGRGRLSLHQYVTHNLFFVLAASGLLSLLLPAGRDRWGLIVVALSHLVLDLVVIDRQRPVGIRLFYPFSKRVFNFGFFPFFQRGSLRRMLSIRNAGVLALEAALFVLPVFVIWRKKFAEEFKKRSFWKICR